MPPGWRPQVRDYLSATMIAAILWRPMLPSLDRHCMEFHGKLVTLSATACMPCSRQWTFWQRVYPGPSQPRSHRISDARVRLLPEIIATIAAA